MNTQNEAKQFVAHHGPLNDLLGTLATYASLAAQTTKNSAAQTEFERICSILVETDAQYRLEKK